MNTHAIKTVVEKDEKETAAEGSCSYCGSRTFNRLNQGRYTEDYRITFHGNRQETEDWDNLDQDLDGAGQWHCWDCGAEVDDDLADWIEDHRW